MEGTCGGYIDRGEGASGREREWRCEWRVCAQRYETPHANTHTREAAHLDGERDVRLRIAARAKGSIYDSHRSDADVRRNDACRRTCNRFKPQWGVAPSPMRTT